MIFKEKTKTQPISKEQVWASWKRIKQGGKGMGIDQVSIEMIEKNPRKYLYPLWNRLSSGSYFPPAVKEQEIPKGDGKVRILGIPTIIDRVAQDVIKQELEQIVEPLFHPSSFDYRYKMISNSYDSEEPTMVRIPLVYAAYGKEHKAYMNKFVTQLKQAYSAQDIIKGVIKRDFKVKPVKVEESTKIKLSNKIKGEDWDCPVYEIKVEYKDKKVSFTCKVEKLGFQSFVEDSKLESKGSITCNSVEEAEKLTQLILKECLLIQYKMIKCYNAIIKKS